jgi:hypothetical protein
MRDALHWAHALAALLRRRHCDLSDAKAITESVKDMTDVCNALADAGFRVVRADA